MSIKYLICKALGLTHQVEHLYRRIDDLSKRIDTVSESVHHVRSLNASAIAQLDTRLVAQYKANATLEGQVQGLERALKDDITESKALYDRMSTDISTILNRKS